jgi:hypothetical protein
MTTIYYIPENLDLTALLLKKKMPFFTRDVYLEKFYFVLTNLYLAKTVTRRVKSWNAYVNLHCGYLQNILTTKHAKLIISILIRLKIIECDGEYSHGNKSLGYRFSRKYRGVKFKRVANLNKLGPKLAKVAAELEKRAIGGSEIRAYIKFCVDNLEINQEGAAAFIATLPEGESKNHREAFMEWVGTNKNGFISRDKNGRIYHYFTSFPRELRKFCTFQGGHPIFQTDCSNFHPALISRLYPANSEEKIKFKCIVAEGKFYAFINGLLGNPFDINDPAQKSALKERAFQEIIYCHRFRNTPLQREFARHFPELYALLHASKEKDKKALPNEILEEEANIILYSVADQFHNENPTAPLISIHDSLCSTEQYISELDSRLRNKLFEILRFNLMTKVERISE